MKKLVLLYLLLICSYASAINTNNAKWITASSPNVNDSNKWIAFRKDVSIGKVPASVITKIAADSKYWLWINGKMVVFEGGLKRGPNARDSYYDEIDLAPFLKKGENKIAILLWYFGKDGFSHKNSGKAGLIFSMNDAELRLISDNTWSCTVLDAYGTVTDKPAPNYRLAESSICYDANKELPGWQTADCEKEYGFPKAIEIGSWGDAPWNKLVKRPIPFWKNFGVKKLSDMEFEKTEQTTIITARLPYNMQMTPIIDVTDQVGGSKISIYTDHTYSGGDTNLQAEYITKKGKQEYESLGWLNGHKLIIEVPGNVTVNSIKYRETGYNTEPAGHFSCSDEFYMRFWNKALRTLYVNMRDTYFDCPDRERAQWWGDAVVLMGESFYTYSPSAHALMKKAIHELTGWQKQNGVLFSPVPSGNYSKELPGQMLASIGEYGFWNYYMHTGDIQTIKDVYPGVKKYLSLWSLDETGLTVFRPGGWAWGDWGENRDMRLIFAGWHYLALKGAAQMANALGYTEDAQRYRAIMKQLKAGYNKCWNGAAYRHHDYKDKTDDRVQALAVISGIADKSKYDNILNTYKTEFHASPYMEKYIMESLFIMDEGQYALERTKKRFQGMVDNPEYTTLFEGWDTGDHAYGGGTVNHAWSGGPLTVISQYLCGIAPLEPGYKVFKIEPYPALATAAISVPSVAGNIDSEFTLSSNKFAMKISVPANTSAVVYLPPLTFEDILVNGKAYNGDAYIVDKKYVHKTKKALQFPPGTYTIAMQ